MNKHTSIILGFKNPSEIYKYCSQHNLGSLIEKNSGIWEKLINKNYNNHSVYKNEFVSFKDYYVLLYYLNALSLLNDVFVIKKSQDLLSLLNTIYEGDHIAIIHASNNIAIRNNKAKVVMYRNKDNYCKIPTYGNGFLKVKYTSNISDSFSNECETSNKEAFNVNLTYGGYKLF